MLFYQIGELFQSYAVGKSRRNISELMDIRPDYANMEKDGKLEQVDPDEVESRNSDHCTAWRKGAHRWCGHWKDNSTLNTSALTGESLPREVQVVETRSSADVSIMTGVLKIRTTKEFGESTVSKILELVENSSSTQVQIRDTLFPNLPDIIHLQSATLRWHWRFFLRLYRMLFGPCHPECGDVDLQSTYFPCNQLPVCPGHQYSAELLCRDRRSQQCRESW